MQREDYDNMKSLEEILEKELKKEMSRITTAGTLNSTDVKTLTDAVCLMLKLKEYEQWMDVSEYLNIMIMNLFYGNIDFPGNNIVFWRPNDDDTESGLPKIWRFIVKDTDFGLGLYNRQNNYNTIDLLYHPEKYPNDK